MTAAKGEDRARELLAEMHAGIDDLVTSDRWAEMLAVASRFHSYSLGNVMLIMRQRPDASRVAGYRRWQQLGRQVRKGERGIAILAPCIRKVTDEETGDDKRIVSGFRVAHIFDLAQTDGDDLPDVRPVLLAGEAPDGLWDRLARLVKQHGFTVERGDCGEANGLTDYTVRTVRVRDDVDQAQACKTLAHELAHVLLHDPDSDGRPGCRGLIEVEAESVACVVARSCGMDTAGYSLPYIARWADGDTDKIKSTAERVIRAAHRIIDAIEPDTSEEEAA